MLASGVGAGGSFGAAWGVGVAEGGGSYLLRGRARLLAQRRQGWGWARLRG